MTQRCTGSSLGLHVTCVLHTAKINNVERVLCVNRIRKIVNTKFGGEMEKYVFFLAFGQRKSSEYPWGIEFPLFKLGYLPLVFCWLVFEKIQAVVVFFLTPCWTFVIFCFFLTQWALFRSSLFSNHSCYQCFLTQETGQFMKVYWIKLWQKEKRKARVGFEPMTSCLLDRRANHLS